MWSYGGQRRVRVREQYGNRRSTRRRRLCRVSAHSCRTRSLDRRLWAGSCAPHVPRVDGVLLEQRSHPKSPIVAKPKKIPAPTTPDAAQAIAQAETPRIKWKVVLQIAAAVIVVWALALGSIPY